MDTDVLDATPIATDISKDDIGKWFFHGDEAVFLCGIQARADPWLEWAWVQRRGHKEPPFTVESRHLVRMRERGLD